MDPVKILVVEDEMIIANNICDNLEALGYEALEPAISYSEAIERIGEESPDIAILDIQLSGKKTGIDLAKEIRDSYDFPFIFLTSNSDPATVNEVKHVMPPAFLVKPFTKDELYSAIEIALHNYAFKVSETTNKETEHLIVKDAIFVKEKGTFVKIKFEDILYLQSSHVYIDIIMRGGNKFVIRGSLNSIISNLSERFVRIHRGYIIHTKHLEKINTTHVSINNEELPIGKKYRDSILKKIIIV